MSFLVLIWTPEAIYFFAILFELILQTRIYFWCSWSIIPQRSPLKDGNIEFAQILRTNCQCCKSMKWKQSLIPWFANWIILAMKDYIVGVFPVLPILMQKHWTAPLSNLVEKTFNWSIWHLTVQNNQFRCKWKIFFDGLLAKSGFSEENIDQHICWILTPVLKLNWCRKYCLLLPSWYLLPPILLSCYYMLCLFDRCNYLDFHTLVYSSNISVFLYIYSKGVWLFASQDIRLQCEII